MSAELSARSVSHTEGVDPVRALQRVLYRSAKQNPTRRFHALYDKIPCDGSTSPSRASRARPGRSASPWWPTGSS